MNASIRRRPAARKRRIEQRLDKTRAGRACPVLSAANMHYEIADRTRAISADFCRRFDGRKTYLLMEVFNDTRLAV